MNETNKFYSVVAICATSILICVLILIKMMVQSAPERNTSKERVAVQQIQVVSNLTEKQLEMKQQEIVQQSLIASNRMVLQQQEMLEYQKKSSNYLAYKAELTSTWATTIEQLKKQRKTDANTVNLRYNELKANLQLKYGVTDTEPTQPTVYVQPTSVVTVRQVPSSILQRYGLRANRPMPVKSVGKVWIDGTAGDRQDRSLGAIYVNTPPPAIGNISGIHQVTQGMWQREVDGHPWIFDEVKNGWTDGNNIHRIYIQNGLRTYE